MIHYYFPAGKYIENQYITMTSETYLYQMELFF